MGSPDEINVDRLAFWNGQGGRIWVARHAHTNTTLAPVFEVLLQFAAPGVDERVLDVGCGCCAPTLEFACAVGPTGRIAALVISGLMLADSAARARATGIVNIG